MGSLFAGKFFGTCVGGLVVGLILIRLEKRRLKKPMATPASKECLGKLHNYRKYGHEGL